MFFFWLDVMTFKTISASALDVNIYVFYMYKKADCGVEKIIVFLIFKITS